jgi:hypothetical protein
MRTSPCRHAVAVGLTDDAKVGVADLEDLPEDDPRLFRARRTPETPTLLTASALSVVGKARKASVRRPRTSRSVPPTFPRVALPLGD